MLGPEVSTHCLYFSFQIDEGAKRVELPGGCEHLPGKGFAVLQKLNDALDGCLFHMETPTVMHTARSAV